MKLHLVYYTFADIMTVNTSVTCFTRRDNLTQRRRSGSAGGPVSVYLSGDPRGSKGCFGARRSLEVPQNEAALAMDTCRALFGQA
jgi:hypothetical protein